MWLAVVSFLPAESSCAYCVQILSFTLYLYSHQNYVLLGAKLMISGYFLSCEEYDQILKLCSTLKHCVHYAIVWEVVIPSKYWFLWHMEIHLHLFCFYLFLESPLFL